MYDQHSQMIMDVDIFDLRVGNQGQQHMKTYGNLAAPRVGSGLRTKAVEAVITAMEAGKVFSIPK